MTSDDVISRADREDALRLAWECGHESALYSESTRPDFQFFYQRSLGKIREAHRLLRLVRAAEELERR